MTAPLPAETGELEMIEGTHAEYSLAPLGWSITRLLMTMYEWSAEHAPQRRRAHLRLAA